MVRGRDGIEGEPTASNEEPMDVRSVLARVELVLVDLQGPRNLGSAARAMRNFGLQHLVLVNGPPIDHREALEMAVNSGDILRSARRCTTLQEALRDATYVVATTAKTRHRLPTLRPREAAQRIVEEATQGRVALVFGREDHGLDGDELREAHATVAIETAPECRALNVSQAVLLLAYELWLASGERGLVSHSDEGFLVTGETRRRLHDAFTDALRTQGLLHPGNEIPVHRSITRLLALGPIQTRDARLLFAMLRRIHDGGQSPDDAS
jgi:tRNA (cytidine32/uridine32-2'-O)-methyltransferase